MSSFNWDSFFSRAPGILVIVFLFGGGMIAGVVKLITSAVKDNKTHERDSILKQQMLERGMSADEIVRVLEAGKLKAVDE